MFWGPAYHGQECFENQVHNWGAHIGEVGAHLGETCFGGQHIMGRNVLKNQVHNWGAHIGEVHF